MSVKLPVCPLDDENPEHRFGLLVHEVAKAWRATLDEMMRPLGLSSAQLTVLCSLAMSPRPLTQRELAQSMHVESPTIVRLLDRLEFKGWVRREQAPDDRRMKHVLLTEKGLPYFDELVRVAEKLQAKLLEGIPEDRLRTAREVLATIQQRLGGEMSCC